MISIIVPVRNEIEYIRDSLESIINQDTNDEYEIFVNPEDFSVITTSLESKNYELEGNLSLIPINIIEINDNQLSKIAQLIESLEEHDDVQKVHANL